MNLDAPSWLVAFLEGVSVWDALILIAALVAAGAFIRKKGWRWFVALARAIVNSAEILASVHDLPAFIERADETLAEHTKQLQNSHTSNLRDDITKAITLSQEAVDGIGGLHGRMDQVEVDVRVLRVADDELRAADDEIRAEIENTNPPKE